jgi:hypothetical protein
MEGGKVAMKFLFCMNESQKNEKGDFCPRKMRTHSPHFFSTSKLRIQHDHSK